MCHAHTYLWWIAFKTHMSYVFIQTQSLYLYTLSCTKYEASRLLIHKVNPTFLFHFCFGNIKSFGPQKKNSKCIQKLSLLVTKNRSSAVAGVSSGNNWIMVMSHSSSILFYSFYPLATQLILRFSVSKFVSLKWLLWRVYWLSFTIFSWKYKMFSLLYVRSILGNMSDIIRYTPGLLLSFDQLREIHFSFEQFWSSWFIIN